MYADGCVLPVNKYGEQEFKIQISNRDIELLEKFKQDIKSTYPIRFDTSKGEGHHMCIQSLRSQKTVNDLKRLGCVESKSLILTFPTLEQVPQQYVRDFIRGYFDGDGSISSYQKKETHTPQFLVNFVGTEQFIKELHYRINNIGVVYPDKRKTNSWYQSISGNLQVTSFYHYLYDGATRYMDRKYQKFQELLKYREIEGAKRVTVTE